MTYNSDVQASWTRFGLAATNGLFDCCILNVIMSVVTRHLRATIAHSRAVHTLEQRRHVSTKFKLNTGADIPAIGFGMLPFCHNDEIPIRINPADTVQKVPGKIKARKKMPFTPLSRQATATLTAHASTAPKQQSAQQSRVLALRAPKSSSRPSFGITHITQTMSSLPLTPRSKT